MRVQYARAWKMDLSDYPVHHDPENVFGSHFDVVLDKGLLDAIACGAGSREVVGKMCGEAWRVLAPGGAFVVISLHGADEDSQVNELLERLQKNLIEHAQTQSTPEDADSFGEVDEENEVRATPGPPPPPSPVSPYMS